MSAIVEAIQAERRALIEPLLAPIADKLQALDEMERLALSLNGGGSEAVVVEAAIPKRAAPAQRVLPRKAVATRRGRDGLPAKTQRVLEAIRSFGDTWAAVADIRRVPDLADIPDGSLRKHIPPLVCRGLVEAKGETSQRRYRATSADNATSGGGQAAVVPAPAVGAVSAPVAARVTRSRILDHLSRRKLDEPSLATLLNLDRETVADLCGALLLDDKIAMLPDGRYEVAA
jgi:hypothetical protein